MEENNQNEIVTETNNVKFVSNGVNIENNTYSEKLSAEYKKNKKIFNSKVLIILLFILIVLAIYNFIFFKTKNKTKENNEATTTTITTTNIVVNQDGKFTLYKSINDSYIGEIYIDPTDLNKKCSLDDVLKNVNSNGTSTNIKEGCMKFYVYYDDGENYYAILDHNTTAVFKTDYINSKTDAYDKLLADTLFWDKNLNIDFYDEKNTCTYKYEEIGKHTGDEIEACNEKLFWQYDNLYASSFFNGMKDDNNLYYESITDNKYFVLDYVSLWDTITVPNNEKVTRISNRRGANYNINQGRSDFYSGIRPSISFPKSYIKAEKDLEKQYKKEENKLIETNYQCFDLDDNYKACHNLLGSGKGVINFYDKKTNENLLGMTVKYDVGGQTYSIYNGNKSYITLLDNKYIIIPSKTKPMMVAPSEASVYNIETKKLVKTLDGYYNLEKKKLGNKEYYFQSEYRDLYKKAMISCYGYLPNGYYYDENFDIKYSGHFCNSANNKNIISCENPYESDKNDARKCTLYDLDMNKVKVIENVVEATESYYVIKGSEEKIYY